MSQVARIDIQPREVLTFFLGRSHMAKKNRGIDVMNIKAPAVAWKAEK